MDLFPEWCKLLSSHNEINNVNIFISINENNGICKILKLVYLSWFLSLYCLYKSILWMLNWQCLLAESSMKFYLIDWQTHFNDVSPDGLYSISHSLKTFFTCIHIMPIHLLHITLVSRHYIYWLNKTHNLVPFPVHLNIIFCLPSHGSCDKRKK